MSEKGAPPRSADEAVIDRWLARQEGMPPGDALGAAIVRLLRGHLTAAEARAVRCEAALAEREKLLTEIGDAIVLLDPEPAWKRIRALLNTAAARR